jgi:NAD(P)H-dependent FMN reductase
MRIAIIMGSTRPGRRVEAVAKWVYEHADQRSDATFEVVDIADYDLPLLDEPLPPATGKYTKQHTHVWAAKIASFDGFVFVAPEYNHSISGALKNAIDFLKNEWHNKAAGFVGYGSLGGQRAVEHLRLGLPVMRTATPALSQTDGSRTVSPLVNLHGAPLLGHNSGLSLRDLIPTNAEPSKLSSGVSLWRRRELKGGAGVASTLAACFVSTSTSISTAGGTIFG